MRRNDVLLNVRTGHCGILRRIPHGDTGQLLVALTQGVEKLQEVPAVERFRRLVVAATRQTLPHEVPEGTNGAVQARAVLGSFPLVCLVEAGYSRHDVGILVHEISHLAHGYVMRRIRGGALVAQQGAILAADLLEALKAILHERRFREMARGREQVAWQAE